MGYTLARQNAYRNAQPTSHETFLLPPSGELENRFDCAPTSVFQRARFSWYFSFRSQFLHSRFRTCRSLQNRRYILVFCRRAQSAKKIAPVLQATTITNHRYYTAGQRRLRVGNRFTGVVLFLKNSCDSHQQIPPDLTR